MVDANMKNTDVRVVIKIADLFARVLVNIIFEEHW